VSLKNNVVVITGASTGIGEELAYQLADQGAQFVLTARRISELERVAANINKSNYRERRYRD
jgi:NADP-dependent 3-hydroxy acid dehydrogenase YdfG